MNKKFKKALSDLLILAVELNRKDFTVFVDFSGHVNWISVSIYFGGWQSHKSQDDSKTFHFGDDYEDDASYLQAIILWLKEASEVNETRAEESRIRKEEAERARYEQLKAKFG